MSVPATTAVRGLERTQEIAQELGVDAIALGPQLAFRIRRRPPDQSHGNSAPQSFAVEDGEGRDCHALWGDLLADTDPGATGSTMVLALWSSHPC